MSTGVLCFQRVTNGVIPTIVINVHLKLVQVQLTFEKSQSLNTLQTVDVGTTASSYTLLLMSFYGSPNYFCPFSLVNNAQGTCSKVPSKESMYQAYRGRPLKIEKRNFRRPFSREKIFRRLLS